LVGGALLVGAITFAPSWRGLIAGLVAALAGLALARVPLGYALRGLLPPLPFLLFLALLQVLFGFGAEGGKVLLDYPPVVISTTDLVAAGELLLRFAALILAISLVSLTLSTTELVRGLESLLRPLAAVGLPTHDFVLMVQVTLRFVPLLAQEAERIAKAQASRGAEWGTRGGGLLKRVRQAMPLILPLFLTALRRAENLALAMAARGYAGRGRTSRVVLRFGAGDALAVGVALCVAAAIVML
jgi:energy-coupling factor transport system permease protein